MRTFGWMLVLVLGIAGLLLTWFFFSGYGGHFFNQRAAEAVSTEKSIAVLPFENISANKDDAYFADGVQDEILNNLAKIAQLKVITEVCCTGCAENLFLNEDLASEVQAPKTT